MCDSCTRVRRSMPPIPLDSVWSIPLLSMLLLMALIALGVAALSVGCNTYRPACTPQQLATIEAAYVAEATAACKGYGLDDCPFIDAIETKYAEQREEWARCQ